MKRGQLCIECSQVALVMVNVRGMLHNISRRQAWLATVTRLREASFLALLQVVRGAPPALGPEYSSSPCVSRNADTQEEGETCVVPREPGPMWGAETLARVDSILQGVC